MRMDLGLTQTIKQIQTLSPQMYMSMEILCMNSLDLEERIETELENNIALEVGETAKDGDAPGEGAEGAEAGAVTAEDRAETFEDPLSSDASFDRKVEDWDRWSREEYAQSLRVLTDVSFESFRHPRDVLAPTSRPLPFSV